jgi:hypothetical protein
MSVNPSSRRYLKLKDGSNIYCLIADIKTTSLQLRRQLSGLTDHRVHDLRIHLLDFDIQSSRRESPMALP